MPVNTVMYRAKGTSESQLFIAETKFNRNMSQIVKGAKDTKTVIFPSTVRESSERTFSYTSVQSVVLNEGLKTIGSEVFLNSNIKRITIPKSVTKIEYSVFYDCKNLKQVMFEEES